MTHEYRYFSSDLLTGNVISELPLYGVNCSKRINDAGNFSGTFKLGTGIYHDQSLLDGTLPGRTALYMERDDVIIWGGILWSRAYQSESKTCQLAAQTFESYFDHVAIDANFVQQQVPQEQILINLVNTLQAQTANNIGLTLASMPTTGVNRTILIPGYEFHFGQEVIGQLTGVENGLEITIDILPSGITDKPTRQIRAGFPKLGNAVATSGLYYDYPGSIVRYWWNESGARGAVKAVALGHGDGFNKVRATAIDGAKIAAGWPAWWIVNSHPTVVDVNGIAAAARKDLEKYAIPYSRPTFEFDPDFGAKFESWNNLGDEIYIRVEDDRFPNGKIIQTRMMGWEISPAEGNGSEVLKISIEGEGDAS